jgi:hypothetical protein
MVLLVWIVVVMLVLVWCSWFSKEVR